MKAKHPIDRAVAERMRVQIETFWSETLKVEVIMPKIAPDPAQIVPPPGHLSTRSAIIWTDCVAKGLVKSAGRLVALQCALEALDRADAAREDIQLHGMICTNKMTGLIHVNPLIKVELEARRQFQSFWDMLKLHWDNSIDSKIGW